MTTLYGIKNCDTVKKARQWLDQQGITYHFHDVRADGLTAAQVATWLDTLGLETLVNKRSTTWKNLAADVRDNFTREQAERVILDEPTLIKRPLLDTGKSLHVGFRATEYQQIFNAL